MDTRPNVMQGFIEHAVKWALALPVQVRHEIIASARAQAHLHRQAPAGPVGTPSASAAYFGDPAVWDAIAARVEGEGHTPAD